MLRNSKPLTILRMTFGRFVMQVMIDFAGRYLIAKRINSEAKMMQPTTIIIIAQTESLRFKYSRHCSSSLDAN